MKNVHGGPIVSKKLIFNYKTSKIYYIHWLYIKLIVYLTMSPRLHKEKVIWFDLVHLF